MNLASIPGADWPGTPDVVDRLSFQEIPSRISKSLAQKGGGLANYTVTGTGTKQSIHRICTV